LPRREILLCGPPFPATWVGQRCESSRSQTQTQTQTQRGRRKKNSTDTVSQSITRQEVKKKYLMRSFSFFFPIHHASGIGGNSPGHPVPRLRFIKMPSEPFTGNPRSVKLCSCSHTGISAGCRGGGTGAPCGKCSPSSSIVIGGGCWGAAICPCGSAKGWPCG
jgi:hypothetical protein